MSFEIVIEIFPEYVRLTATGEHSLVDLFEFIDRIKFEADNAGRDRALIDSRKIEGIMSEADRFLAGQRIAEVLGPRLKAVVIMPAQQITKLGELTAVNRGANFLLRTRKMRPSSGFWQARPRR